MTPSVLYHFRIRGSLDLLAPHATIAAGPVPGGSQLCRTALCSVVQLHALPYSSMLCRTALCSAVRLSALSFLAKWRVHLRSTHPAVGKYKGLSSHRSPWLSQPAHPEMQRVTDPGKNGLTAGVILHMGFVILHK